jgi:hypothetical protein
MKKIHLFLVFALCLSIFSACKKEEQLKLISIEKLVDKPWLITDSDTEIAISFGQLPDNVIDSLDPAQQIEGQTITFDSDGTFIIGELNDIQKQGRWTLSEDAKTLVFSGLISETGRISQFLDAETRTKMQTFGVTTLTDFNLILKNSNRVDIPRDVTGLPLIVPATIKLNIFCEKKQ